MPLLVSIVVLSAGIATSPGTATEKAAACRRLSTEAESLASRAELAEVPAATCHAALGAIAEFRAAGCERGASSEAAQFAVIEWVIAAELSECARWDRALGEKYLRRGRPAEAFAEYMVVSAVNPTDSLARDRAAAIFLLLNPRLAPAIIPGWSPPKTGPSARSSRWHRGRFPDAISRFDEAFDPMCVSSLARSIHITASPGLLDAPLIVTPAK